MPKEHQQTLRKAMCDAGAGFIGNYSNCTFSSEGVGTFLPLEETKPYLGKQGVLEQAQEVRLETIVPNSLLHTVLEAMKKAHPYEEPAYDIYTVEPEDVKCLSQETEGNLEVTLITCTNDSKRRIIVKAKELEV